MDSWEEGLLDMCIGEKRTLTIPPSKGYGQRAMGPIPAGSTLSKSFGLCLFFSVSFSFSMLCSC